MIPGATGDVFQLIGLLCSGFIIGATICVAWLSFGEWRGRDYPVHLGFGHNHALVKWGYLANPVLARKNMERIGHTEKHLWGDWYWYSRKREG